jgi:hypothetical protein
MAMVWHAVYILSPILVDKGNLCLGRGSLGDGGMRNQYDV